MNMSELVDLVAERTGVAKKDVAASIAGMLDVMAIVAERTGVSKKDVAASIAGMFDVMADAVSNGADIKIQGWPMAVKLDEDDPL